MVEGMAAELSGFSGGIRGDVRIHARSSAVVHYLPHEIAGFAGAYPQVRVILREAISPDIIAAVGDGTADIGIFADNMGVLLQAKLQQERARKLRMEKANRAPLLLQPLPLSPRSTFAAS